MNYDKAQKFILAELIKYPLISRKSDVGFSDVLVTCDGEVGFVFPKSSLMIDLSVVQKSDDLGRNMEELIDPSNLLQRTKAIIDTDGSSSGYLSVLRDGSREVYVKTKYIKLFGESGRMRNIHFKDMKTSPKGDICPCGQGVIDFAPLKELCEKYGIENAFVEQDNAPDLGDVFVQMKESFDNLKPLF